MRAARTYQRPSAHVRLDRVYDARIKRVVARHNDGKATRRTLNAGIALGERHALGRDTRSAPVTVPYKRPVFFKVARTEYLCIELGCVDDKGVSQLQVAMHAAKPMGVPVTGVAKLGCRPVVPVLATKQC